MLKALSDRSLSEVRGLLAQATLSLMPHPEDVVVEDDVRAVILEARQQLRIPAEELSPSNRTKLQQYLGDLLADQLLPKSEQSDVRSRLGNKGLLEPNQFDIQRNPTLTARGAIYRAKWSHIEDAIHRADVVEHFRMVEGLKDVPFTSLFMRRPPSKAATGAFWWLIECRRAGSSIFPNHAWRLYDDTFDFSIIGTPRDAIVALAERFGQDLKIGEKYMKIAFREVVPNPGEGKHVTLIETPGFHMQAGPSITDPIVGFSYIIDNTKYLAYLDKHGVSQT
jgi:hypothetical protein